MILSAIVSLIAVVTVIVVTVVVARQTRVSSTDMENKLQSVVKQVNTAQQYSYEFDKNQQQQVDGLEKNIADVRAKYVSKDDQATRVKTNVVDADSVLLTGGRVNLTSQGWNSGMLQFDSQLPGASRSPEYTIQRGTNDSKNHLVIQTPLEDGSGVHFMGGKESKMFLDASSGNLEVQGNIHTEQSVSIGNNYKFNEDDPWLTLQGDGLKVNSLWADAGATIVGKTQLDDLGVKGGLTVKGGVSSLNPNGQPTEFAGPNGGNRIRGDTDIQGNTQVAGNMTVGNNVNIDGKVQVNNAASFKGPVKINHDLNANAAFSVISKPGEAGAALGSEGLSYFPWVDGNTYIRPGLNNRDILIGDWGARTVAIGKGDTSTRVNGSLTVNSSGTDNQININTSDNMNMNMGVNLDGFGVSTNGDRSFAISTNNKPRIVVGAQGGVTLNDNVNAQRIGPAQGQNDWFRVNENNISNSNSQGTALFQGASLPTGGGLSIGELRKVPEGNMYVRDSVQVRHKMPDDWLKRAGLSVWTPAKLVGASFGGPDNWSHLPWEDGNTYIRSGIKDGAVLIGDQGTKAIQLGAANTQTTVANSIFNDNNGDSRIRSGALNKNIHIGDQNTKEVNLGNKDNNVFTRAPTHFVGQGVDAWDTWEGNGKVLFTGWNSDKTVLGSSSTAATNYVKSQPVKSVVSANDLYVYGKSTSTSAICIQDTCIDEANLKKLKSLV